MEIDNFWKIYVAELQELRDVEDQLVEALPRMGQLVASPQLRQALESHLNETRAQRTEIDRLLLQHNAIPTKHEDSSMRALIREADRWATTVTDPECRDAGVIASVQRIEHYEIAVYGTLATWARDLQLETDFQTLDRILEQERRADATLTRLAKTRINSEAAADVPSGPSDGPSALEDASGYVRTATRPISHLIEDNPLAAMLLAGAAGYFLAYYTRGAAGLGHPSASMSEPRSAQVSGRSSGRGRIASAAYRQR